MFLQQMTRPFGKNIITQLSAEEEDEDNVDEETLRLMKSVDASKIVGFLHLCEDLYDKMKRSMRDHASRLVKLTLCILRSVDEQLKELKQSHEAEENNKNSNQNKKEHSKKHIATLHDIRNMCIRRITDAIKSAPDGKGMQRQLRSYLNVVRPALARLPQDCRSGPSALLKSMISLGSHPTTAPLLATHGWVLQRIVACFSDPALSPAVPPLLLEFLENLLSLKEHEDSPVDVLGSVEDSSAIASELMLHLVPPLPTSHDASAR